MVVSMDDETRARFDHLDRQLAAIVARLDEQDLAMDRIAGKVTASRSCRRRARRR